MSAARELGRRLLPLLLFGAIAGALYARSLPGPFFFDDTISIVENPHVRALWPLSQALGAPPQTSVAGRPLASLSFALSYYAFGLDPRGWRALNVALHTACGLLLFGLCRRALARTSDSSLAQNAPALACAAALLWLVHPLATDAVAYVTQRTELLWSLAFLGALYAAERGFERERTGRPAHGWLAASALSIWIGVAAKEVMAAGPPLLLLYDRAFESGSLREAWRRHRALHAAAFASWLCLAVLVASGPRDATVGFALPISAASYALTQLGVIAWYLRLAFWPAPLVIAHDWPVASSVGDVWLGIAIVAPLFAATVWACVRKPQLGFLGAWFFAILAPTSSVVPIVSEIAAERRMYLPLAAVTVGIVVAAHELLRARALRGIRVALASAALLVLAGVSALRLELYRSTSALWSQVLEIYPEHRLRDQIEQALGQELAHKGDLADALPHFTRATELRPDLASHWSDLGRARVIMGDLEAAATAYERAADLAPDDPMVQVDLGFVFARQKRWLDAERTLERALVLDPGNANARKTLARVLVRRGESLVMDGNLEGAVPHFQRAVNLDPDFGAAQQDLGETLIRLQRGKLPPIGEGPHTPS
ncbi:MAG TPA: tetratricopeptide repeat protein [Myxococcota bacterium]|nr:tetratricopeptide repeat protein [Myxococcota bacterium]